jgi:hypothetical protein
MLSSLHLTTGKFDEPKLLATYYRDSEPDALRLAIRLNLRGWETVRIERLGDCTYIIQLAIGEEDL